MCGFMHNKGVEESYLLNLYVPMQYSAFLCFKCDICLFKINGCFVLQVMFHET